MKKRGQDIMHLREIFKEADHDHEGCIRLEDFHALLEEPRVKTWLSVLELEVNEITGLFELLDDGDGRISFEEFLSGVLRLRGGAKSVDLVTLLYENKKIVGHLNELKEVMEHPHARPESA